MTSAVLAYNRFHVKIEVNWKFICFALFLSALASLVFYAWQINILTRGYYLINSYEKEITSLSKENKNLEFAFAASDFWGRATEKIHAMNFQKTTAVKYIQVLDTSLVTVKR